MPWLSKQLRNLYWRGTSDELEQYRQRLDINPTSDRLKPELRTRLEFLSKSALEIMGIRREQEQ